ncbi:pyroglutamyl-peptidase I [Clostridium sp. Cult2]|uniref:pyroglutamyl-peptidase I n=1 Tax=Clostridium sp. Cult2 TaxID=2079003 RepID=UPI001F02E545|nr:pyroglutamyl-peptidase I [Clostridium sp. Cult2]MCF6466717.1 pyroglutamyl-peptidase I [Clostridium sp. Cult2]
MKVLVTGFDPFGGEKVNPAYETVKRLGNKIEGAEIVKLELPTVFRKSIRLLEEALEKEEPDIVICVGQRGGADKINVERIAINISDARIPDNEGNQPVDEPIFDDGDNAYFSKLPVKSIIEELNKNKIPAEISNSAGTYVCNHIMYGLLYNINKKYPNTIGGFIHIPFIPDQVIDKKKTPSMSLDYMVEALTIAIKVTLREKK